MLDTEPLASEMEFLFTHGAQGTPCSDAWHTDLTCLTSCCRDDHHLRTGGDVLSKSAPRAEAFIIRMGEDSKNAFGILYCGYIVHWRPLLPLFFQACWLL